jgi:MFS transporter, DHA1 family, tetracycline resistance protein
VFGDRAIAGLMSATIPIYFASVAGQSTLARGILIGLPLLLMAVGAWPAGYVGDRIGHLKLRTIAALLYAGAIASVPFASGMGLAPALGVMALVGLAGAALLPSTLTLATGSGRGSVAMGSYRASGDLGYLLGIAMAGTMLALLGGATPEANDYTRIIVVFAGVHFFITILATFASLRRYTFP